MTYDEYMNTTEAFPTGARIRSLVTGAEATYQGNGWATLDDGQRVSTRAHPTVPTWELVQR